MGCYTDIVARDKKKDCKLKMEDSYNKTQGICSEVNVNDVIIEKNALHVNRSHNECDNLMGKVFNNDEEAYNFYNEYAIRTAGFLSSQRSESTNNVLGDVANKTTSLVEFVKSFEKIIKGWRSSEVEEDFRCNQSWPPQAIKGSGILNHATNVYTHKLFKLFEEEFKNAIGNF
ncbi:unnamed protein product [Dovyalis caffra]|uniref:Protein FAR1-RELATED SEQUENCE n=1 Tax=Dovyalis caffra TaxID=77055 RepID=A0AAV1RLD9_9ROSI|nr:unnamed protein product [Dovyalis caffra]